MLTDDLIAKIGKGLDAMPPKPASRREIELLVMGIETKIRAAQERGASFADIAKQITDNGYPIKPSTLRVALQRHRKKDPSAKRAARRTASEASAEASVSAGPSAAQAQKAQRT